MLDLTGIVFSSVMILLVIVRALQLDRTQPWFQSIHRRDAKDAPARRPWQRPS